MASTNRYLSGCFACPVNLCDATYRGSRCSAKRARAGVDFDPKTNAEEITNMTEKELRKALMEYFLLRTKFTTAAAEEADSLIEWLQKPVST